MSWNGYTFQYTRSQGEGVMSVDEPFSNEQREVLLNAGLLGQVLLELKVGTAGAEHMAFLCRQIADAYIANQKLRQRLKAAREGKDE